MGKQWSAVVEDQEPWVESWLPHFPAVAEEGVVALNLLESVPSSVKGR